MKNEFEILLVNVFKSIRQYKYCVLRNGRNLPYDYGRDIDLFCSKEDFDKLIDQIKNIIGPDYFISEVNRYAFTKLYIYYNADLNKCLMIDVWSSLHWRGRDFISERDILNRTVTLPSGIKHLELSTEVYIKLAKGLLQRVALKEKYFDEFDGLPTVQKKQVLEFFGKYFNRQKLIYGDYKSFCELSKVLKRVIVLDISRTRSIVKFLKYSFGWLDYFFQGNGKLVVFVGPDGSGKSSLINSLLSADIPFQKKIYKYSRYGFIPRLGKSKNSLDRSNIQGMLKQEIVKGSSMPGESVSRLKGFALIIYYSFDFLLAHVWLIKEKRLGSLIVFDRYSYDYYLQKEYKLIPNYLKRFITYVSPRPDFLFLPIAPAEAIHSRKPELSVQEIQRQQNQVKKIKTAFNGIILDTNTDIRATNRQVFKEMFV
jgi:thymidylate kinase